jgi:hypothetical protein
VREREREKKENDLSCFLLKAKDEKSLHSIKHMPQECILNRSSSLHISVVLPPWEEPQIPTGWEAGWASELFGQYQENNQTPMFMIYISTNFHVLSLNSYLFTAMKLKSKFLT